MRHVLAGLAVAVALAGCGEKREPDLGRVQSPPVPASPTSPPQRPAALAIGITEPNPAFFSAGPVGDPFEGYRERLVAMRPHFYRLFVDWSTFQTTPDTPPDFTVGHNGCMRDIRPCAPWNGLRAQLEALAARQRAAPGRWRTLVVLWGTPGWAAPGASGCERENTQPRSRPPRTPEQLTAYREFVKAVAALAAQTGAQLEFWSPWNEPNQPFSLAGQRSQCDAGAPSLAASAYAEIFRAAQQALAEAPGEQQLVAGELAGILERTPLATPVQEFIAALPRDVVCATPIWSQHSYVGGPDVAGNPAPVALRALDAFDCPGPDHEVWITETGTGADRPGRRRGTDAASLGLACRRMAIRLRAWHDDPRVSAAFQYTLREDDQYPTGLAPTDLGPEYPALALWERWAGEREPADPPPGAVGDLCPRP